MNIPNVLTVIRIALIPCIVVVYYLPYGWSLYGAAGIFAMAAATDWLDGYLARKLNQSTAFGAFLDPVADKLMVSVALVMLVESYADPFLTVPAVIIIGREIVISALREWMAELGKRASVAVSIIGKLKTMLQMLAIFLLLGTVPGSTGAYVGEVTLYAAAVLTLWSMWMYLRAAWPDLVKDL
ncbi:CDP-diacylglycerol--glycerol-3-phosphate 3-phosphatidyltransferase [Motiliproteus sp. MSK22-1]|uniref:CDP-diacylglycerol--glycerol-3-phosphate 3-phosphatidyltransferase n=1 Tax=Motiliproteus sp. MSK22-1 TaxID=1897630 RepID=UPI0009753F2C|nr:CDP-diacylglycerol--glycerol-3-phosphate 3-phosphatidyltransferase [Motiliproteus sp. MSK22-1]OMH32693.1 CDP-diacylglycerol--glycerol-3-phosphate 3-phosphatidyltransferase [Motiliproteus sp. MSK22-1]